MENAPAAGRPPAPSFAAGLFPNLLAGTLAALVTLSDALSYGALIFSGPELAPHLVLGLRTTLTAAWVLVLVAAIGSSLPFSIAGPNSNAVAILALMAGGVASRLAADRVAGGPLVSTVLMLLSGSALAVGLIVFVLGALRHGQLVRFIPYPLAAGFLAGTGFLILIGGIRVLTGESEGAGALAALARVPPLGAFIALLVALVPLALQRLEKSHIVMPTVILAGSGLFYVALWRSGASLEAARVRGFLLDVPAVRGLPVVPVFRDVLWERLLPEWQHLLAMALVVVVAILLNATGLELATRRDVDFDRELRVNGIGNVAAGLLGGTVGYLSISRSLLNHRAGALSRVSGIWSAFLCLGATVFFLPALALVPRPVLAGLLIFSGLSLLRECAVETFFRLPLLEYGLIVAILALIVVEGLVTGVAFGLVVASVFFVYSYSRTGCVKATFRAGAHFSNKDRPLSDVALLRQVGGAARALALQGYLFFGTTSAVVDACRKAVGEGGLRYLLLDFRLVQGLDSSAVWSFTRMDQLCAASGVRVLFSGVKGDLRKVLEETRFLPRPGLTMFEDLDRAFEWIEDRLLEEARSARPSEERSIEKLLAQHLEPGAAGKLLASCEAISLAPGEPLFRRGDPGGALYFIERGSVSVLVHLGGGQLKRLRTCGAGTVVGEMALYTSQPRSADVVADGECRVLKLSAATLARLEVESPAVAHQLHRFVVKLLSSRLISANDEVRALL